MKRVKGNAGQPALALCYNGKNLLTGARAPGAPLIMITATPPMVPPAFAGASPS